MKIGITVSFVFIVLLSSFSINVCSQEIEQLTNTSKASQQPCVSSSGNFIIYSSGTDYTAGGEGSGIWRMNIDGSNQIELLASDGTHNYNHPSISPDDNMVVFSKDKVGGGDGLWILYLNNLTEKRMTFSSDYEVGTEWSPNGNEIYFYGGPYGVDYNIKRLYLNNLTIKSVTDTDDIDAYLYLSPDGTKIVFNRVVNSNNFDIFIINSDGTNLSQITDNNYKDYIPSWGSDNKIYFSSNRNGTGFDIWRMNIDGTNQKRLSDFEGNELWPEYIENGIFFYWDKKSDNSGDIWFMFLNDTPNISLPTPTQDSLILTTPQWRNVVSVVGVDNTMFVVEDNVTGNVMTWINENEPDYVFTLGFDAGMNNSYEIGYGDVPGLFYPNAAGAVLVETDEEAVLGSQIASLLGIPLVFEQGSYADVIDLIGMSHEDIQERYLDEIEAAGGSVDYLIPVNTESGEFPLSGRLAFKKVGFIVPVTVNDIGYDVGSIMDCRERNIDNRVPEIVDELEEAATTLGERGLFAESRSHVFGTPVYIALFGGFDSFPTVIIPDPGIEGLENDDGDYLFSDILFSDLNRDGFYDSAIGRFSGGLESISMQIENIGNIDCDGVVIGQYRYPKYKAGDFLGGGMFQAYAADYSLSAGGMDVNRLVEKRLDRIVPGLKIDWLNLAGLLFDIGEILGSASFGTIGMIYTMMDMKETVIYAWLEFDWKNWYWHATHGGFVKLEHLEVFDGNPDLDDVGFLGYFGVGDEYWKVPPDDRTDTELVFAPYARCEDVTELDYNRFLYDDHDMSAYSEIVSDVMERGGTSFTSTGLIHDPFTQRTSMDMIGLMSRGLSVGEARRLSANTLPIDPWFLAISPNPVLRERPDLYLKDVYERVIFGDPETSLGMETVVIEGDEFSVSPHNSYLAESYIDSEYHISRRKLIVENADTEIIEIGEPVIPVFVREIVLPEGSDIIDVSFEGFYRRYWRLRPTNIPLDEHYDDVGGSENYEDYWYNSYTLLDNRVLVKVFVPAVEYGRLSRVLKKGVIKIEYDTPVEVSVSTSDITMGEDETIEVTVFNDRDIAVNGTLFLWVGNENHSGIVEVGAHDSEVVEFIFTPDKAGEYTAKAVFDGDEPVGPRYSSFRVKRVCKCPWKWCEKTGCGGRCKPTSGILGILSRIVLQPFPMTWR